MMGSRLVGLDSTYLDANIRIPRVGKTGPGQQTLSSGLGPSMHVRCMSRTCAMQPICGAFL